MTEKQTTTIVIVSGIAFILLAIVGLITSISTVVDLVVWVCRF